MWVYLLVKQLVCWLPGPQELLTVKNSVFMVKEVLDTSEKVMINDRWTVWQRINRKKRFHSGPNVFNISSCVLNLYLYWPLYFLASHRAVNTHTHISVTWRYWPLVPGRCFGSVCWGVSASLCVGIAGHWYRCPLQGDTAPGHSEAGDTLPCTHRHQVCKSLTWLWFNSDI